MKTRAYYNENDPFAAEWLRNLIKKGKIARGDVDERSITEVERAEISWYTQCHFFAGIGVWSYALRRAGWPDDRPVWTGSCPCQPFSAAGRKRGFADERHLWPVWHRLITKCRPPVVFGEQVANPDGLGWFDVVSSDLEGSGYAVGAADLCAAGVGGPHIRQRLFFVADASGGGWGERRVQERLATDGEDGSRFDDSGGVGQSDGERREGERVHLRERGPRSTVVEVVGSGPACGFWQKNEWISFTDGKRRPIEPGTFPLAHGAPSRVGRLRAYGNAIVAPVAEVFVRAYLG